MRLLTCALISCAFHCNSQSFSWTRDFKTNYDTYGRQVLTDPGGNAYVVSDYYYLPHHEPSVSGCVLQKYDRSGALLWSVDKQYEHYWKILFDQDGQLILFAKENGVVYTAHIDPGNGLLTQKKPFLPGAWINSVEFDKSGNLFVTGLYTDSLVLCNTTHPGTSSDVTLFIAKYDPAGACVWSIVSNGTPSFGYSAIDPFGNIFVTGAFYKNMALGNHVVTGDASNAGFLAKIDPDGEVLWVKRISDPYSPSAQLIAIDHSGNVLIGGDFDKPFAVEGTTLSPSSGKMDAFVLKLNNYGHLAWLKGAASSQIVALQNFTLDQDDNLLIAGAFKSDLSLQDNCSLSSNNTITYNYPQPDELFLARWDENGKCRWAMKGDCASDGKSNAASVHLNNGYLYVAGSFDGNVFFGEPTPHQGGYKMFVSKILDPFAAGISEDNATGKTIAAFPNPASEFISLQGLPEEKTSIAIVNCVGEVVTMLKACSINTPVRIKDLPAGAYFINATQPSATYRIKFLKSD